MVQRIQGGILENMSKPLAGGHELLLIHQEFSGSGEDHANLRRMESIILQRQGQKDKDWFEDLKSFIHGPKEGTGNDPSFVERRASSINKIQFGSRAVQRQAQRTS
ncbi:hypothetical protein O181_050622 [Austropuccinia psidii MF-1]|uniref:Uncharacterized protein n=1 Tax=Austropuccinia psidii MF-1 TaxID=1389203 RepID=A0A9Q3DZB8_9BASI|nr:hypothetical protein [Austropuccinia psidii MF-1]